MNDKKYNWEEFTQKDLFKAKLEDQFPYFGYIPCSKRAKFIQFCVDTGFLKYTGLFNKTDHAYIVLSNFSYGTMAIYRATTAICKEGEHIILDKASRPKTKLISRYVSAEY